MSIVNIKEYIKPNTSKSLKEWIIFTNQHHNGNKTHEETIKITMSEQAWYDLASQKQALLEATSYLTPEKTNRIQGILNLIDVIQDQAVDTYKIPADIVFPFSE